MATLISKATGNWTAAGTWAPVSAASAAELDSEAGSTASTTSYVYSATFTLAASDVDAVAVKIASRTAATNVPQRPAPGATSAMTSLRGWNAPASRNPSEQPESA